MVRRHFRVAEAGFCVCYDDKCSHDAGDELKFEP